MIDARFMLALLAAIGAGTLAASLLGALNVVPFQVVHVLTSAALAALCYSGPVWCRRIIVRLSGQSLEPRTSLGALGAAAALVFTGLGGFVLSASAVNDAFVSQVWRIAFPGLPVFAALAGLGRQGYLALLRWLDAEARDDE